jgi:hypothetical protein
MIGTVNSWHIAAGKRPRLTLRMVAFPGAPEEARTPDLMIRNARTRSDGLRAGGAVARHFPGRRPQFEVTRDARASCRAFGMRCIIRRIQLICGNDSSQTSS